MGFVDLGTYLDDDGLDVPVGDRVFRIPSPDHATGLRLTAMVNLGVSFAAGAELSKKDAANLNLDDEQERDFLELVLGPAYPEMVGAGVSWVRIQRVGRYALLYFTLGPEAAAESVQRTAEASPSGEAPAPNRAARRAPSSKASSGTAKSSTRARGSSAGTTSRPSRRKAT